MTTKCEDWLENDMVTASCKDIKIVLPLVNIVTKGILFFEIS